MRIQKPPLKAPPPAQWGSGHRPRRPGRVAGSQRQSRSRGERQTRPEAGDAEGSVWGALSPYGGHCAPRGNSELQTQPQCATCGTSSMRPGPQPQGSSQRTSGSGARSRLHHSPASVRSWLNLFPGLHDGGDEAKSDHDKGDSCPGGLLWGPGRSRCRAPGSVGAWDVGLHGTQCPALPLTASPLFWQPRGGQEYSNWQSRAPSHGVRCGNGTGVSLGRPPSWRDPHRGAARPHSVPS